MSELTKSQAIQRLKNAQARAREMAVRSARIGSAGILAAAGGAAAGVLNAKFPKIPGTEAPTDMVLGAVLLAAAASDMFSDAQNEQVAAFAGGLLAVGAARETQNYLATR